MSESGSTVEPASEWTVISDEGLNIDTPRAETGMERGAGPVLSVIGEAPECDDQPASLIAEYTGENRESLYTTLKGATSSSPAAEGEGEEKDHVSLISWTESSDIIILRDQEEDLDQAEDSELYLGPSAGSMEHSITPAGSDQQSDVANSGSVSEDVAEDKASGTVCRRRLRKSSGCVEGQPDEESLDSDQRGEKATEDVHRAEEAAVRPPVAPLLLKHVSSKFSLMAVLFAICLGFGTFYVFFSTTSEMESLHNKVKALWSDNQRLAEQLEEANQLIYTLKEERDALAAQVQTLRGEMNTTKEISEGLKDLALSEFEAKEKLIARVNQLEKRLNFEEQRSDLWERLYREMKDEHEEKAEEKSNFFNMFT